jgi:IS5 family transposase
MVAAPELLDFASGAALIGDTGYDSNEFRAEIKARGIKAVISSKPERKQKRRRTASWTGSDDSSRCSSTA